MPKSLVLIALLCPLTLQAENVAPGIRMTPETRVAKFTVDAVQETYLGIVAADDGFNVRTLPSIQHSRAVQTHVDFNGTPDLSSRAAVGGEAYIQSSGRPLYFWSEEDGFIYASRVNDRTTPSKVRVAHGQLIRATCGDSACFFAVWGDGGISTALGAVITDLEGQPLTSKTVLPYFRDVMSMPSVVADPSGFTYLRVDGGRRTENRAVRVDLRGQIVFDVPLRTFEPRLRWFRDHYIEIGNATVNGTSYLTAADLTVTGELRPPRILYPASYDSPFQIFTDGQNLLLATVDQRHVSVLHTDDGITFAALEYKWDVPASFYFVDIAAKGRATVAILLHQYGALYTMSVNPFSTPKLLSYGPRSQTPIGVAQLASEYLV
ncbi:MAG: hypothetical protein DMF59_05860, partial [Acidobacteria bacterium]